MTSTEHFDVVLIGAGISGLGMAHHLQEKCATRKFVILEEKHTFGGTWVTHTYPGIRSDSDLYTFGYAFKPWTGAPIADAQSILGYLEEVIEEDQLAPHIRYQHKITAAHWSSEDQHWRLVVQDMAAGNDVHLTCDFFIWTGGYYNHAQGYTPDWPGMDQFTGRIVHPQTWPEDLDLKDQRVVVIGSGATAATLIPNIADQCAHVTMLQRSPTYFWTGENRNELADRLRNLEVPEAWVHEIVRRDLLRTQQEIQATAAQHPEHMKEELLKVVRQHVGESLTAAHFTPSYRPWQQRLAFVPDADLFKAITKGQASIVTDHIERFTPNGIQLQSGDTLEADVIITATGFNVVSVGGIECTFDGAPLLPCDAFTYRGLMLSGFPNFAFMFGYLRTSWTMRVDLVAEYLCRLLNHMEAKHAQVVTPQLRPQDKDMQKNRWIAENEFNPGYMNRGIHHMPKSGDHEPWIFSPDYYVEKEEMPHFDLDEDALIYEITDSNNGS
ncbi:MAG: NAD(P)/FAD-dependent oxidoreductase [Pseudomonadota bacterium]